VGLAGEPIEIGELVVANRGTREYGDDDEGEEAENCGLAVCRAPARGAIPLRYSPPLREGPEFVLAI
jgi:hypothetical protein